jgi:hypothetical protein
VAAAFLLWSARGQSIEPAHRFLGSVADGRAAHAAGALGQVVGFGHSSGADLARGLRLGLTHVRRRDTVVSPA